MRPNIEKRFEWMGDELLFQCECKADHFFRVSYESEYEKGVWIEYRDLDISLWRTLKNWWKNKWYSWNEIMLSDTDIRELHKMLGKYLEILDNQKNQPTSVEK